MNNFIWKGKDPAGNVRSEQVRAANAQEAKRQLVESGWSDLHLVMDEVCDAATANVDRPSEYRQSLSPDDQVRLFETKGVRFWREYGKTLYESKGTILILLLLLGYELWRGRTSVWWLLLPCAGLAFMLLLFPAIHIFFSLPMQYYSRLNQAKVWSRWTEVLQCVERLRQVSRLTRIGPGQLELTRCRAQALAALDRLEDGVREFSRYATDPAVQHWFYLSQLAGIYDCAKQFEKALEYRRQAVAEKPESASVWIDLAGTYVRGLNYPAEARVALARAEALEIPALGKAYVPFLYGVICWREGRMAEAKGHLEQALAGFQPYVHHDLIHGVILLTKAYLCAVCGAMGETEAARQYFQETEKFLAAGREEELLAACRAELEASRAAAS